MREILPQNFFNQPTLKVAQNLLGKFLVRRFCSREIALMITEVEAYDGFNDKASHASPVRSLLLRKKYSRFKINKLFQAASNGASRGKTKRNQIMFGEAGRFYVYFTYGMHWMLNIVTGPKNYPAAVLIRAADGINGPAKLTKYLKIDKKFNGLAANKRTGLWFKDGEVKIKKSQIKKSKRIGVEYAGEWANKPYRFTLK